MRDETPKNQLGLGGCRIFDEAKQLKVDDFAENLVQKSSSWDIVQNIA